jgi:hypothetical protein
MRKTHQTVLMDARKIGKREFPAKVQVLEPFIEFLANGSASLRFLALDDTTLV